MPVVPTTAYSQAEEALTLARALMNDSSGAVFTDVLRCRCSTPLIAACSASWPKTA
jgi:hypothetical protein